MHREYRRQRTQYEEDPISPRYRKDIKNLPPLVFDEKRKIYLPNPVLVHTTPYWLTFTEDAAGSNAAIVPANSTLQRNMNNDKTALVDLRSLMGVATSNNYIVRIYDNEYQRDLSNRPLHANTIIGVSTFPNQNPIPFLLSRTQSLFFFLTDLSGAQNTIRLTWQSMRYYFNIEEKILESLSQASEFSRLYYYTTDQDVTLPVGTTVQQESISIISEADFMLHRITSEQTGDFLIRITDAATGCRYMNGWIHSSTFSGNAQNYYDIEPMLLQRKSILSIELINLDVVPNTIYLTLNGANYYYKR